MLKYQKSAYRRFAYFFKESGGTTPPAPTFLEALRDHLKAQAGLAGLTDVYLRELKPGWQAPALVVSPIGGSFEFTTKSSRITYPEVQFSVVANDPAADETAWNLGEAAFDALDPEMGAPALVFRRGAESRRWPTFHERLAKQPGRGAANTTTWTYSFGYRFMVTRYGA